jgi:O-methyltransferase / aklanonic acid methyltransferase
MNANRDEAEHAKKQQIAEYFSGIVAPDYGVDARFFPAMGRRLVERAHNPAGARVLDVAAGRGAILFPAAEQVGAHGQVIGIDLAEAMVRATAAEIDRLGLTNVEMRQMDAEQLELDGATFDGVLCGFALFFFPQLDRALAEFYRVLKPGGKFGATTFGETDERLEWYEQLLTAYKISRPIPVTQPLEKPAELEAALNRTGFTGIQIIAEDYDSVYANEEEWWSRLWASGDRKVLQQLEAPVLERFKIEAFDQIQAFKRPDGIHRPYRVLFTLANKPQP